MEIKIGIQNITREATLNIDLTISEVMDAYRKACQDDSYLTLTDSTGRQMVIPASQIGYLEFGQENARPVGFGT